MPTAASPVALYTPVDVPDAPFELKFDYAFLNAPGSLKIEIDGVELLMLEADPNELENVFRYTLQVHDPAILQRLLAELAFTYDGLAGSQMFLDNITMPGLNNGDFAAWGNGWFSRGNGDVDLIATVVPEPGALCMVSLLAIVITHRRVRPLDTPSRPRLDLESPLRSGQSPLPWTQPAHS